MKLRWNDERMDGQNDRHPNQICTPFSKRIYNKNQGYPNNVISLMSLRLKVAENQLEPLEVSFTIQRLRASTTMQKQYLHQRPLLLARVTFIAARGSTAIKSVCCFNKISVLYYLPVEVRTTFQSPCFCNQKSVLLSAVSLIATRDHYCYQESLSFPLEVITVIQIPCLCHQRSIIVTIGHEFASRGQYCYTETLSLQLEVSFTIRRLTHCH